METQHVSDRDPLLGETPSVPERRPGELGAVEMARWTWRQLTSMRTALVLLLLLALAAIPGSVIPQTGVDSLKTSQWQERHPHLTPVYDRLGLFNVYGSPWFSAIYLLLFVSLVGCILPRLAVYWRALRARPPAAPRTLTRLPGHTSYVTDESPDAVLARARAVLGGRRYRLAPPAEGTDAVAAERGHLREAGNLLFHLALLVVLTGFAVGSLFGYKGGVIVITGNGFSNTLTQYDDFRPGRLFDASSMEPFRFTLDSFDVEWVLSGRAKGMDRKFVSHLTYWRTPDSDPETYDLRVNHPLAIGGTEVFLIGHGYAPVITVRDGDGDVVLDQVPTVFLPQDKTLLSFGAVKAPDARPDQIGLEGFFYPTYLKIDGDPVNVLGDDKNPTLSLLTYKGDLGLDNGLPQSVYVLDKSELTPLKKDDGRPARIDLQVGDTVSLVGGGSATFDGVKEWNRFQISRSPGKLVALGGVVAALVGLLGSLFVRPRRVWVRARRTDDGTEVEVAGLERTDGGDLDEVLAGIVSELRGAPAEGASERGDDA
ncbi:MAG: cytochrome c biogenesis protein ResB [Nocardioidaceae bacterium]